MSCYIDTSALAKWYVREGGSEAFEKFILTLEDGAALISSLTITEMRSLLARHRRMGHFDGNYESAAWQTFLQDVASGALRVLTVGSAHFVRAAEIIDTMQSTALRTLDALHLALASNHAASVASADRTMLQAARDLELDIHPF